MTLTILPDVEAELSRWLRSQSELEALIDKRVYTVLPGQPVFPLVTLRRITGAADSIPPSWFDRPVIQVEALGGTKAQARLVSETVRALFAERLLGEILNSAMVTVDVSFAGHLYLPDPTYEPAKPRYLFSTNLAVRPTATTET